MDVGGVVVAAVGAEGEFQVGLLRSGDECIVGDVGYLVDLDRELALLGHVDDVIDALRCPELCVLARDRNWEKGGPGEDIDRFGGHHLLDEFHIAGHEFFRVVHHGVDLPDGEPGAVGIGESEGVHEDVVELVENGLGEGFGPSGIHRLQADADRIFAEVVDIALEVGIGVEGESCAGMLDDADVHAAFFAELDGTVNSQRIAEVDVIVGDGELWLGGPRFEIRTSCAGVQKSTACQSDAGDR